MAYYLKEIIKFDKKVFTIGTTGMVEELDALNIPHTGSGVGWIVNTLFLSGHHFSILLFACKLALVALFKGRYSLNFDFKNEATRANLQVNKKILKWQPFWNKVYCLIKI